MAFAVLAFTDVFGSIVGRISALAMWLVVLPVPDVLASLGVYVGGETIMEKT